MGGSDYTLLAGGEDEVGKQPSLKSQASCEERPRKPWLRLLALLFSLGLCGGVGPGAPVWMTIFQGQGILADACQEEAPPCGSQFALISTFFTLAGVSVVVFGVVGGFLLDTYGGRAVGCWGGLAVVFAWFLMQCSTAGPSLGIDWITGRLLLVTLTVLDWGSKLNSLSLITILFFFPGNDALILALVVLTEISASFTPLMVQQAMRTMGVSLNVCLLFLAMLALLGAALTYWNTPSKEEYTKRMEDAVGKVLTSKSVSFWKQFACGCKTILRDWASHLAFMIFSLLALLWTSVYTGLIYMYGLGLFGGIAGAQSLARACVIISCIVGVVVVPAVNSLAQRLGIGLLVALTIGSQIAAHLLISVPSMYAQIIVCFCGSISGMLMGSIAQIRLLHYATPGKFGIVSGTMALASTCLSTGVVVPLQLQLARMPDPLGFLMHLLPCLTGVGAVSWLFYGSYFWVMGLPQCPTLLPEEEQDLCQSYGCATIDDILYVLHFGDRNVLQKMLVGVDTKVKNHLLMQIDGDRMVEKMMERSLPEIMRAIESGIVWRRKVEESCLIPAIPVGQQNWSASLAKFIDESKFGKGSAKTLQHFKNELRRGRSQVYIRKAEGGSTTMLRTADVVLLRVFSAKSGDKMLLVEKRRRSFNGRVQMRMQLPGTKKGPGDCTEACIQHILEKYSLDKLRRRVVLGDQGVEHESIESPSYPGVFTTYQKQHINVYLLEEDACKLAKIGLPRHEAWTTHDEKSGTSYDMAWVDEATARAQGISAGAGNKSMSEEITEARGRLCTTITESLEARRFSKELCYALQMDDGAGLEQWLWNTDVCSLRSAFKDMNNWMEAGPDKLNERLRVLIPEARWIALLHSRPELKPLVIDLLRYDLVEVQRECRKAGIPHHFERPISP